MVLIGIKMEMKQNCPSHYKTRLRIHLDKSTSQQQNCQACVFFRGGMG